VRAVYNMAGTGATAASLYWGFSDLRVVAPEDHAARMTLNSRKCDWGLPGSILRLAYFKERASSK